MGQDGRPLALCKAGLAQLGGGQLAAAERSFSALLELQPRQLQAVLALGVIAWQQQRHAAALGFARRALRLAPGLPSGHLLLARVLRESGALGDAVAAFRAALRLVPADNEARLELAQLLADTGQPEEAMQCYAAALLQDPANANAHYNLGNLLLRTNQVEQAEQAVACYQAALALQPGLQHAQNNLGTALRRLGRVMEAESQFRDLAARCPSMVDAHYNLGNLMFDTGHFAEAASSFRRALELSPDHPDAANNLGSALVELGEYGGAEQCLRLAVQRQPDQSLPVSNLGVALREIGRVEEALACFTAALDGAGDTVPARNNLATTLLQTGQFAAGWEQYESRWERPTLVPRPFVQPLWQGEALGEQVLLLHAEQGMGDTLQFCRYVRLAAARARVVLEVQPPLRSLLARSLPEVEQIVCRGEALPPFDRHCPLLSLPRIFGTRLETIPAAIPYLTISPVDAARWRDRVASLPGRRVGLVWRGNPAYADTRKRDMDAAYLALLDGLPGVSFVSLQTDLDEAARATATSYLPMADWTAELTDFDQTASLLAGLDLVIGVDTAVVHLAGALGRPVWLLNRFDPCWRWLRDRADSPWYPTLRQFRQAASGDWAGVIGHVAAALAQA